MQQIFIPVDEASLVRWRPITGLVLTAAGVIMTVVIRSSSPRVHGLRA